MTNGAGWRMRKQTGCPWRGQPVGFQLKQACGYRPLLQAVQTRPTIPMRIIMEVTAEVVKRLLRFMRLSA
jgi:hypothetical protein